MLADQMKTKELHTFVRDLETSGSVVDHQTVGVQETMGGSTRHQK